MDLFTYLIKSVNSNSNVLTISNLVISIIGLIWIYGINATHNKHRKYTWLVFWGATAAFYLLKIKITDADKLGWIPYIALDVSFLALLIGVVLDLGFAGIRRNSFIILAFVIAIGARLIDIHIKDSGGVMYVHQLVITLALLLWAWRHSLEDVNQSLVVVVYALIQFPFQQMVLKFGILPNNSFISLV